MSGICYGGVVVQWLDFSPVTQKPSVWFPAGGESGATVYWTNVLSQWTWHKLHHNDKSGTAEEWRGGPFAILTQVVAHGHANGHANGHV